MTPRVEYSERFPDLRNAMRGLEHFVHQSGLDPTLLELVKLRASLINGCAYCVDMHTKVARSQGETEQRLYEVSLWREAPFFTERERAALAWTEAVTLVSVDHVPDEVYELARQHFDEKDLVALTAAIVAINGWNRLAVAFRTVPGKFQLGHQTTSNQTESGMRVDPETTGR
ncbi:MAG: carboxymuconolactone decarboxylase family protein [Acidobacteriota bacterium]